MSVLYLLVIASIAVAATFLIAFIWSIKTNQYEDQKGSAMRMLYDNDTDIDNKQF
ncbi:MAG: cbb3-type cytochrome oxidase assembly protein CcoS [Bacteroidetes bacterium]|nr:cbb3-type cytochrome oxidase assembly protein CcoS [Bacteroidota bacterium]